MSLAEGTIIDERYEVLSSIGFGGMGVVYEAYHRSLERVVAVKMLTGTTTSDDEDRQRFGREAKILSRLAHPNVVQFYAYGIWTGVPYIVIERVNGQSLQHLLAKNQPLGVSLVLDIARQICDGLQHVHAKDVLHRDLKPTNVLVVDSPDGRRQVKLIDFGLAKIVESEDVQKLTQAGMMLGTVMYASPEQCLGQPLDARSDIYSLGCVLYQMLTGYPPYTADNATAVMFQQLNESVGSTEHWSEIPLELQPVLSKCMAKEKEGRYSSALALNEDLGKILDGQSARLEGLPVSANAAFCTPSNPFPSGARPEPRFGGKQFIWLLLAFLVLCLIIAASFLSLRSREDEPAKRSTLANLQEQLHEVVYDGKQVDEVRAKLLLSLIESYKRDRHYPSDRSELVLQAYTQAVGYYNRRDDYGPVRQYAKQALDDCRNLNVNNGNGYVCMVLAYHEACVPVHCNVSLVPLLQDTLKRYPEAGPDVRAHLYSCLGEDYLELERFDSALKACHQAASLAVGEEQILIVRRVLLKAYQGASIHHRTKKNFTKARDYCKKGLSECRNVEPDQWSQYFSLASMYSEVSHALHSEQSSIPLLQDTLKRYPKASQNEQCVLYCALARDYLALGNFDAARQAANKAGLLAIDEAYKTRCKVILQMCDRRQKELSRH